MCKCEHGACGGADGKKCDCRCHTPPSPLEKEYGALKLHAAELQKKLDLAYPVIEAARTVYEIREKAQSRSKSIGAVIAYEETREDHLAACDALDKTVAAFNAAALELP